MSTYEVSKNLTERLVMSYEDHLKVCIMRTAIVGAISRQPHPGYVGNTSGMTGFILASAYGDAAAFKQFLGGVGYQRLAGPFGRFRMQLSKHAHVVGCVCTWTRVCARFSSLRHDYN